MDNSHLYRGRARVLGFADEFGRTASRPCDFLAAKPHRRRSCASRAAAMIMYAATGAVVCSEPNEPFPRPAPPVMTATWRSRAGAWRDAAGEHTRPPRHRRRSTCVPDSGSAPQPSVCAPPELGQHRRVIASKSLAVRGGVAARMNRGPRSGPPGGALRKPQASGPGHEASARTGRNLRHGPDADLPRHALRRLRVSLESPRCITSRHHTIAF